MTVDLEFQQLIPRISSEEAVRLEASLVAEKGARDSLVVWEGLLLDGHHRLEICERLGLPYQTTSIQLPDRDAAKIWIIENQFGRRNINAFVRSELALKLEPLYAARAAKNVGGRGKKVPVISIGFLDVKLPANLREVSHERETSAKLAKIADVSPRQIQKVKALQTAPEEVKDQLRKNEISINKAYLLQKKEKQGKNSKPPKDKRYKLAPWWVAFKTLQTELKSVSAAALIKADEASYKKGWGKDEQVVTDLEEVRNWLDEVIIGLKPLIVTCKG